MRITFVITGLGMGGAEVQVCTLAAGWVRRGVAVQIVSMIDERAPHPQLADGSIAVSTLGMKRGRWRPGDLFRYARIVRDYRPDIVHSQMFHANLLARAGRPLAGAPLICTAQNTVESPEHTPSAPLRTRLREIALRLSDPLCALTTQVSAEGAERFVAVGATPASKMRFVPNAVDLDRFQRNVPLGQKAREELGVGDLFTWMWIGRVEEQKDPWTLLRALQILSTSGARFTVCMVGAGSLETRVREETSRLGVSSQVRFLGQRRDVPALLNAADAQVLSSRHEGLPLVLLEASACELPVVTTVAGGEVVVPDRSGFVVPAEDPRALAERMRAMMALPPETRRKMGEEGRRFVASKYGLEAVLDAWQEIYTSILKKNHAAAER